MCCFDTCYGLNLNVYFLDVSYFDIFCFDIFYFQICCFDIQDTLKTPLTAEESYGVATISRLLKITGLFCRIWSLL